MNRKLKRQLYISAVALGGAFAIGPAISKADTVNVVAGDTVWGFAQKYHTSINKIVQDNHIKNPNLIYIGQKLLVPGKDTTNNQDNKPSADGVAIPKKTKPTTPQKDNSLASSSTSTTTPSNSSSSSDLDSASNNLPANSSAAQSSSSTAVTSNADSSSTASATQNTDSEKASSQAVQSSTTPQTSSASSSSAPERTSSAPTTNSSSTQAQENGSVENNGTSSSNTTGSTTTINTSTSSASASTSTSSALSSSQRSAIVALANTLANSNIPYVYGGSSLSGFDCSGLVQYVYANAAGITLSRTTTTQAAEMTQISVANAQPGDILFWQSGSSVYHDAIYIGNNQYVAAPDVGQNVKVATISSYFMPSFAGRLQ
ncbi:C40 family peptidase [Ligilactobacillus acidipiscis]|uniref:C40 family peptidase n=1 Tax=Ligilactobacillus acidipiscis TaxID=89059 RepID=UPI0023F8C0E1|nr:C40 family peptidase [Ligilactobacillus acidipiscis]WEV56613.1 NlpC/P60 family protein [Ligilactobacillus acidipiscis]